MTREAINELKKYVSGKKNTEKVEISVLQLNRIIKALEQEPTLDEVKAEIENIEINGHIRDVECFNAGINTVLNIIDKYQDQDKNIEAQDAEFLIDDGLER